MRKAQALQDFKSKQFKFAVHHRVTKKRKTKDGKIETESVSSLS